MKRRGVITGHTPTRERKFSTDLYRVLVTPPPPPPPAPPRKCLLSISCSPSPLSWSLSVIDGCCAALHHQGSLIRR